jgi:uncharacterized protein YecE (DUF72 family)
MVAIFVGTSGWIYPHWRGRFYPRDLPESEWLSFLSTRLSSVEVNATFYRMQRLESFVRWRESVSSELVFAVKASRYVTHLRKLGGGVEPIANFFAQGLLALGAQLGPILWQLPPTLGFDAARADAFFRALPRDVRAAERLARRHDARVNGRDLLRAPDGRDAQVRHALEVRHPSWLSDEALALLEAHDIALVTADTAGRHPRSLARTADFVYLRLHGSRELYGSQYNDAELDEWAAWLRSQRGDRFVYFDNDARAYAPVDASRLLALLPSRAQRKPRSSSR